MYAEAVSVGFTSINSSYNAGPDSVNFNKFWEHYNPAKGNLEEALFETPAGKMAKKLGMRPTDIHYSDVNVSVIWLKD
jgi:hypothetical protein